MTRASWRVRDPARQRRKPVGCCFKGKTGAALRVKNGSEFAFGRVRFVFGHDCLHCEAVLVVYEILPTS